MRQATRAASAVAVDGVTAAAMWVGWMDWAVAEVARRRPHHGAAVDGDGNSARRESFELRGDEIRALRLSVGMSQRELATRLDYSPQQVCAWEHARSRSPIGMFERIQREIDRVLAKRQTTVAYVAQHQQLDQSRRQQD